MDDIVGAYLQRGGPGANGDVIVDLLKDIDMSSTKQGVVSGSFDGSDLIGPLEGQSIGEVINLIKENNVYVNLHTTGNQDGEIRGQVK